MPWLQLCLANNRVDLVVVLKDAQRPGKAEDVRQRIQASTLRRPGGLAVVAAAATPSIEGWLLLVDEGEQLTEVQAKQRWRRDHDDSWGAKAAVARTIDLELLRQKSPSGYAVLADALKQWWHSAGATR